MSTGYAIYIVRSGVIQILMMAAPILLVGMVTGLIVSILQATTSIQEQTLTFIPKIAAILGSLVVFGPWIVNSMTQYTIRVLERIPDMAK
jgi:flagellar biosynthetic protein FliQ